MSQSKLQVKTQNKSGGNPVWKNDLGYAALFVDGEPNKIIVDAFTGYGASYKRRDKTQIVISQFGTNYTFNSFDELFNLIKKHFPK